MPDFGGKIRFRFGGNNLVIRGKFSIEPASEDRKAVTNQNGSVSVTREPMGPKWKATFEDTDDASVTQATSIDWNAIMTQGPIDVTIPEDDTNVMHTYSACRFIGRPEIDRLNGEVTGIEGIASAGNYKRTTTGAS